jgi:hypothetical protein
MEQAAFTGCSEVTSVEETSELLERTYNPGTLRSADLDSYRERMPSRIVYRVDFYEGAVSTGNAVFSMEPSATPFSFAVGEFVDPSGWPANPLPAHQHYEITAVEHQITDPGGPEIQHNIAISVKPVPR